LVSRGSDVSTTPLKRSSRPLHSLTPEGGGAEAGKASRDAEALTEGMRRVVYWTSGVDRNAMQCIPLGSVPGLENCVYIAWGKSALAGAGALGLFFA
jgi:hypothetical protein